MFMLHVLEYETGNNKLKNTTKSAYNQHLSSSPLFLDSFFILHQIVLMKPILHSLYLHITFGAYIYFRIVAGFSHFLGCRIVGTSHWETII